MGVIDSYNDISGVSEAVLKKKFGMVEAGDVVFRAKKGEKEMAELRGRATGHRPIFVRSRARAVIADVPGPLTPRTPK